MAKLIVILGFALSFAAGLVIGSKTRFIDTAPANAVAPTATPPTTGPDRRGPGGWLSAELGLTGDQRSKLDGIWSAMASRGRSESDDKRREFRRERDTAIAELVPPARMGEYDQIMNAYSDHLNVLDRESREAYEAAVERTKQILTPEQRLRYEELLKRHSWGPGAARDRHAGRRSETRATSQPDERTQDPSPSHTNP